jgi:hypothetical protein
MDAAEVIYRNQEGATEELATGERLPGNRDLTVESIDVDEEGEWVMIEVVNRSTGSEGGIMIPKGRVVRINEGAARNR